MKKMKQKEVIIFMLIIFAVLLSLYFDIQIVQGISLIRNNILDNFFLGITFVSSGVIIFFVLTSLFLWKENKRRWIIPLWLSLFLSAIVSFILKISIQRLRPYQISLDGIIHSLPVLQEVTHSLWDFSFPSFQAMLAFCAIPILAKEFPKLKYAWIVFASLIAFSRVYFGVHFLSDVIAGALIGYILGMLMVRAETEYKLGERIAGNISRSIRYRMKYRGR